MTAGSPKASNAGLPELNFIKKAVETTEVFPWEEAEPDSHFRKTSQAAACKKHHAMWMERKRFNSPGYR